MLCMPKITGTPCGAVRWETICHGDWGPDHPRKIAPPGGKWRLSGGRYASL